MHTPQNPVAHELARRACHRRLCHPPQSRDHRWHWRMVDSHPGRHLQPIPAVARRDRAAVMVAMPPVWVKL